MPKTLEEILDEDIEYSVEDSNFYYLRPKVTVEYDNTLWRVDKKTKKVEYMDFTEYILDVYPNIEEIDISDIKRSL